MSPSDFTGVPLRVAAVSDPAAATDAATRIPGPLADGTPLDPVEVAAWHSPDDDRGTDYEDPAILRAGDSGQTFSAVVEAGPPADLPGCSASAIGDGDGGE
ncbi:hypothetical protein [Arthrobacter burdickii]|uniref:Uncharacterized protein n=1 Tax=Arthrobacter burdickii TaxID=3035920 RepID=A0ABT8JZI1_9MICC|nr:hypothetical protein [Arthrobacter burdickii]MDN4610585.1 hypothetical protein [Arthrobacter burdickii]